MDALTPRQLHSLWLSIHTGPPAVPRELAAWKRLLEQYSPTQLVYCMLMQPPSRYWSVSEWAATIKLNSIPQDPIVLRIETAILLNERKGCNIAIPWLFYGIYCDDINDYSLGSCDVEQYNTALAKLEEWCEWFVSAGGGAISDIIGGNRSKRTSTYQELDIR